MLNREFDKDMFTGGEYIAFFAHNFIEAPIPVPVPNGIKIEYNGIYYYVSIEGVEHPVVIMPNPMHVPAPKATIAMTNSAVPSFTKEEAEQLLKPYSAGYAKDHQGTGSYVMMCNGTKVSPDCKKFKIDKYCFIIDYEGKPRYIRDISNAIHSFKTSNNILNIVRNVELIEKRAMKVLIDATKNQPKSTSQPIENKHDLQNADQTQAQTTNIVVDNLIKTEAEKLLTPYFAGETRGNCYVFARDGVTKVAAHQKKFMINKYSFIIGNDGNPIYICEKHNITRVAYDSPYWREKVTQNEAKALEIMKALKGEGKSDGFSQMTTEYDEFVAEPHTKRFKPSVPEFVSEDASEIVSTQTSDFPQWNFSLESLEDDFDSHPVDNIISDDENVFGIPDSRTSDATQAENKVEMSNPISDSYPRFFSNNNQETTVLPPSDLFSLAEKESLLDDDMNFSSVRLFLPNYDDTLSTLDLDLGENDRDPENSFLNLR